MSGLRGAFEFTVIGTIGEPFRSRASALGARCVSLPTGGKWDPGMIFRLRREFRAGGVSLVHTHDTRGGLLGRIAARMAGLPALHTVHTPSFFLSSSPVIIQVYRMVERILNSVFSDGVIFVSPTIRRIYLDGRLIPQRKALLVPNGLEAEWFESHPPTERGKTGTIFLYVGRLAREKGLPILASAFSRVAARFPQARLQVVGDGPELETLVRMAEQDGWKDRLMLLGNLDREQTRQVMQNADVFVLPSRFESMSYTLLEAMACGLPCIATDVGGNRDLVETERTGLLAPAEDSAALAEAMSRLAGSPEMRAQMGRAGLAKVREFSVDKMVEKTREIYARWIGGGSSHASGADNPLQ